MRPTTLRPGQRLLITNPITKDGEQEAFFVRRTPAQRSLSGAAINYVRFPAYAGLDGPDDDGTCQMSDYDLSRRGRLAD